MATTIYKHACLLLTMIMHMTLPDIMLLEVLFWTSRGTLQVGSLEWSQLVFPSLFVFISNGFLFFTFLVSIGCSHHMFYYNISCFVKKNKKSHVSMSFLQKFFRIHNIVTQLFPYFERIVSKEDLTVADAKQKWKNRTWFTMTIEVFNGPSKIWNNSYVLREVPKFP